MLKIIDSLKPFFENCYARISVRQYARLIKVSPPTASSMLKQLGKEGLLIRENDRNYMMFRADRESRDFIMLSRMYWQNRLSNATRSLDASAVVLFGSLSKGEAKPDSDIDLAVLGGKKKTGAIDAKIGRKIQVFWFDSAKDIDKELRSAILNGHIISGRFE